MMKSEDEEQLRPENSSAAVPTPSPDERSRASRALGVVSVALASIALGGLLGRRLGGPRETPGVDPRGFVTDYDLVSVSYETPGAFEADARALGVREREFDACESSTKRFPKQKVCVKVDFKCYAKRLKYEKDANGEIHPIYVKEGANEIDCPTNFGNWLWSSPRDAPSYYSGWPNTCQTRLPGVDAPFNICYVEYSCVEQASQWSAAQLLKVSGGYSGTTYAIPWPERTGWGFQNDGGFWSSSFSPSWSGGVDPSNVTYPVEQASLTPAYKGKFCLQRATLRALSRRGWELIEPDTALEPYFSPETRTLSSGSTGMTYPVKVFKVMKRSHDA